VTRLAWVKMPRSWSTNWALRCAKLFSLTGVSMFMIITIIVIIVIVIIDIKRGVGSHQTANHPQDQNMRKRQLLYLIFNIDHVIIDMILDVIL
jgi:hypothetical protein